ncbi:hypothetical protein CFC21_111865 [Triticum aestivum]|uniref:NAC domain-containing protein n=3 Tax=Triticinae TaxID=1648030 RepID=A0A453TB03_AEGTS|nr:NAC domain-containing protein 22 [Aegilops tauschii subsp. strangulata]XP_044444270.1 NAC domain-containing protein 22-like [Triticum aestivum]KAF7111908.1 hypothetical protein CFC21_111865 [Triticum aestivum]
MERRGGAAAPSLELPGFRFHPTEEELLEFYLKHHVTRNNKQQHLKAAPFDIIPTVHLYRHDPWDLPGLAAIASEREWYFFVPRDGARKHASGVAGGGRPSRTTERGFWKATGSDRAVRCAADPKRLVGLKKTLVYYQGRAPRGTKTDWVMNEYRLPDLSGAGAGEQQDVVLCKVYRKAVSLKELEQRVAMEELARARSSPPTTASHSHSHSHCSAGSPDVSSASELAHEAALHHVHHGVKKEEAVAVARPPAMRLPQLETAKANGGLEWMQDPFLTQLRSPWMEGLCLSPYYASVLNF